jgi:hypothetical protein
MCIARQQIRRKNAGYVYTSAGASEPFFPPLRPSRDQQHDVVGPLRILLVKEFMKDPAVGAVFG